jgi:hypothetical protein
VCKDAEAEAAEEDKAYAEHLQQHDNTSKISLLAAVSTRESRDNWHKAEANPETQGIPPRVMNIISRADDCVLLLLLLLLTSKIT